MSYDEWCSHLAAKSSHIRTAHLGFQGKNKVIFATGYGGAGSEHLPVVDFFGTESTSTSEGCSKGAEAGEEEPDPKRARP